MVTALAILLLALGSNGYKNGVSQFACDDMYPNHYGSSPQKGPAPYHLSVEDEGDNTKKVTLDGGIFKGFFIQAREELEKPGIGEFAQYDHLIAKTVSCFNKQNAALAHVNNTEKSSVTAHWTSPPGFNGSVVFYATVVEEYKTFWVNIQSEKVDIDSRPAVEPRDKASMMTMEGTGGRSITQRCGESFGCMGVPPNCIAGGAACSVLLTYAADKDGINYQILAPVSANNVWIAAGVSEDNKMDKASVVECILANDQVSMRESWNGEGNSNKVFQNVTKGVTFTGGRYADGMLSCAWHRHHVTEVEQTTFETEQNGYYVLLASGELFEDSEHTKRYHSVRGFSAEPLNLNLNLIARDGVDSDLYIKLHGSLMITAWLLLASLGILVARHYKDVGGGSIQICGVKPWFWFHRGVMVTSVCMMLSALGLIFYKIGGWSPVKSLHPLLGIVSSALGVCQPIMALFRCGPDDQNRYIFNQLHWFVGNVAQILAVATIFLAFGLEKAQLANSHRFLYILGAFVGFHVLVHVVVQLYSRAKGKKTGVSTEIKLQDFPVDGEAMPPQRPKDHQATKPSENGFRLFVLGFYMGVALLAAISLMITVWVAPSSW